MKCGSGDCYMETGMGGIRQCGVRMENWNDWKWKMDALE